MPPLRVMLATASPSAAARLSRDLSGLPDLLLTGHAADLSAAYILAERTEPDVAIVGADLSRSPDFEGLVSMFRVLGTAWVDLVAEGPAAPPVGASVGASLAPARGIAPGMPPAALLTSLRTAVQTRQVPGAGAPPAQTAAPRRFNPDRVILIGASTGGIDALLQIISTFPPDCPPTAIVQHTGTAFSDSLIRLFTRCCPARIVPAGNGGVLEQGTVIVGAGCGGHLLLKPGTPRRAVVQAGPPVSGHVPSVDAMFLSAVPFAPSVTAALLTGMGRDGAQGLLALRRGGARTLAQDEATSVVFGMPRAAIEMGAAEKTLPLQRIAAELLSSCAERTSEAHSR